MIAKLGKTIIIKPEQLHKATLVWLHGLGDTAEGSQQLFKAMSILPHCKYVLLTAPLREVTANFNMRMPSWYDIESFAERKMNEQVVESAGFVSQVLSEEEKAGVPVVLGGFSQGGGLSLYTGLVHHPSALSAVISLSGYAMNYVPREDRTKTPVFLYNGQNDDVVSYQMATKTFEIFKGFNVTHKA